MQTAVAKYYDAIAPHYRYKYLTTDYYRRLYVKLGAVLDRYIKPGMRVLDVGAGVGFWTLYMKSRGARVVALDISQKSLETCKCGDKVVADAGRLPSRRAFDAVTALGSVYNHADLEAAVAAAAGVVKRGGLLIADVDNALCLDMLYEFLIFQGVSKLFNALRRGVVRGSWESIDGEVPFNYYTYFYVKSTLHRHGFRPVASFPIYLLPPLPTRFLQKRFRLGFFEKFDLVKFLTPLATTVVYVAARV